MFTNKLANKTKKADKHTDTTETLPSQVQAMKKEREKTGLRVLLCQSLFQVLKDGY